MEKRVHIPWRRIGASVVFLIAALIANYYATAYATESASSSVTDIILSNTPVFDLDWSFVLAPWVFWLVMTFFLVRSPVKIPFTLSCIALLLLVRSIFISLTHIGPFPGHLSIDANIIFGMFTHSGDLFFSGHTAIPFMMALVFWHDVRLRWFCIASSIFFGIIVLLAHVHYSIDVAAAFFITYTVHHLATIFFKSDLVLFREHSKLSVQ